MRSENFHAHLHSKQMETVIRSIQHLILIFRRLLYQTRTPLVPITTNAIIKLSYDPPIASAKVARIDTAIRGRVASGLYKLMNVAKKTASEPIIVLSPIHFLLSFGKWWVIHLPTTAPAGSAKNTGASILSDHPIYTQKDTSMR